jgi:NAD(P)-dependent dehydrogenase (short-subunit alcohol dehydrogenase family)
VLRRFASAAEVADLVALLLSDADLVALLFSDEASEITGTVLEVCATIAASPP